jgi:type I restriction enzyme M protein
MNLFLHGIKGIVVHGDALTEDVARLSRPDLILANPPFGSGAGGARPRRVDLPHHTSNKQLMFLQHVYRALKKGGKAAVIVPDNVLFEEGVGHRVRADLMAECNLHTILRLPQGIFYAQGVNTNVLFFDKGALTKEVWFYDLLSIRRKNKITPVEEAVLNVSHTQDDNLASRSISTPSNRVGFSFSSADKCERRKYSHADTKNPPVPAAGS